MDELEALNMLLRLIGSSPVNDIDSPHPDATNAKTTLNRIRRQVQRRGWWFNIDYKVTYTLDENSKIRIPEEISSFVAENKDYIKRGNFLYNKVGNTFIFTSNVIAHRTVRILDWVDMPDSVQEYCAYFAASQFLRDELEDPQKQADAKESAKQTLIEVRKQDLEEGQYNAFTSTRTIQARSGVRPYKRSAANFYGTPDV